MNGRLTGAVHVNVAVHGGANGDSASDGVCAVAA